MIFDFFARSRMFSACGALYSTTDESLSISIQSKHQGIKQAISSVKKGIRLCAQRHIEIEIEILVIGDTVKPVSTLFLMAILVKKFLSQIGLVAVRSNQEYDRTRNDAVNFQSNEFIRM